MRLIPPPLLLIFVPGFALAELEDGTFALSTSNSSLAVQNSNYVTRIHLFTAGSQVQYIPTHFYNDNLKVMNINIV